MAERRLAVICSHLRPPGPGRPSQPPPPGVSASACHGDGAAGASGEKDCVFCMIVRGESPAFKLYEDEICLCILDSNPLSHGHSLVIPKTHFTSLGVTPPSVVAAMSSKVPFLCNAIMKAAHCDSFNLLVNNGSAAGQVIFHTHFHIIPRKAGDQLWPSERFGRHPLKWNQETFDLVDCIRESLSSSSDSCRYQEAVLPKDSQSI